MVLNVLINIIDLFRNIFSVGKYPGKGSKNRVPGGIGVVVGEYRGRYWRRLAASSRPDDSSIVTERIGTPQPKRRSAVADVVPRGGSVVIDRTPPDDPEPLIGTYRIDVEDGELNTEATASADADEDE